MISRVVHGAGLFSMGASITRAMRSFAGWATGKPWRLVLLTIICAHLLAPVASALLVVDALRRGAAAASVTAALTLVGLAALSVVLQSSVAVTMSLMAPVVIGGVLCGMLLAWSRNLSLAFQVTLVGIAGLSMLVLALVPGASQIGVVLQDQVLALMQASNADSEGIARTADIAASEFVRVYLVSMLVILLAGLLLGLWWYSLLGTGVNFGTEFRALKLGRYAGIALMVLVILGQAFDSQLIYYVAPMAVIGFLFQGLAVFHARARSDNWNPLIVRAVYVALVSPLLALIAPPLAPLLAFVVPLTIMVLMTLSAAGLVDNFFDLRSRARPGS